MTRLPNTAGPINGGNANERPRELRSIDLDGRPAPLLVSVDTVNHEINPWDLRDETGRIHLRDQWTATQLPIDFDIRHLLDWDHEVRFDVLSFITSLGLEYRVHDGQEANNNGDLFDVVLTMMVDHEDTIRCERSRRAATETAGLTHPGELRTACSRILSQLQQLHVRGFLVGQLVEEARAASLVVSEDSHNTSELVFAADVLTDAPVPDNLVLPPGWQISTEGVRGDSDRDGEWTITTPVLISRRLVTIQTGTEFLELVWRRPDGWHRQIVERVKVATTRDVVQLAALGLPVNSNNAAKFVQYLADFEAINMEQLPCERVARQLGWQETVGCEGFLWGRQLITGNTQTVTTETEISNDPPATCPTITFRGADEGDDQLAAGYHSRGSFEAWYAAVGVLGEFPRVRLAIYAALSTVVLKIVGATNYVLSYGSPTSQGKTTTIRVAASCWGCPNEQSPEAAISTWDATPTWIERAGTVLCDHPQILDDTKMAEHPDRIARVLYNVTSGRGRGRGSVDGMRGTGTFRTVLISSGEAPITSFSRDAGTRARVLELWGQPFERADATTAPIVISLNLAIAGNYGHAGPRFVQYLVDNHSQWETWRQNYQWYLQQYVERAGDNSVASRLAGYFAVLELTAQLSSQAEIVPWQADSVVADLWPVLTAETVESDQAEVALRYVWSWAGAHQESFHGRTRHNCNGAPSAGWVGRWAEGERWEFVGFCQHRIERLLIEGGFEPVPALRTWADRGWLRISPGRRFYKCRIGDVSEDMVAITRETIDRLMGDESPPPRPPAPRGVVGRGCQSEAAGQ